MYDEFGNMSVHIMNPERAVYPSRGLSAQTAEQLRETLRGYVAYFGTYEINERESYVVHHRRGHLSPNQVGVDAKRFFEFDRDRLTLIFAPDVGSVAVLTDRTTKRRYRVREGDWLGDARVDRIRVDEVAFTVAGFGLSRTEVLRVAREDQE